MHDLVFQLSIRSKQNAYEQRQPGLLHVGNDFLSKLDSKVKTTTKNDVDSLEQATSTWYLHQNHSFQDKNSEYTHWFFGIQTLYFGLF